MTKQKQPNFSYDKALGSSLCSYEDQYGRWFLGAAFCAPEDEDVKSELTGCTIAECRAKIDYAKTRKLDMQFRYEALRDLYFSMQHSSHYNPKSYEARRVKQHYMRALYELKNARVTYKRLQDELKNYIKKKDYYARKYREKLDSGEKNQ